MHHPSMRMHFSVWVKLEKSTLHAETLSQVTTFSFISHHLFPTRSPSLAWPKFICDCTCSHPYRSTPPPSLDTHIMLMHRPSERMNFSMWVKLEKATMCVETLSQVTTFLFIGHHFFPTRSRPSLTWPKSICHCTSSHAYRWGPPHSLHTNMMLTHCPSQRMHFFLWVKLGRCTLCEETLSQVPTFSFMGHHLFSTRSPPCLTWSKSFYDCTYSHAYRSGHPHSLHTNMVVMHHPSQRIHFYMWVKLGECNLCA